MRRKSSSQIKSMIFMLAAFIVIILIGLIVFVLNVNIEGSNNSEEAQVENTVQNTNANLVATDAVEGIEYRTVSRDGEGSYEVVLRDGKLYFKIIDEEKFADKFSKNKVSQTETEIAIHGYKLTNVFVGKYNKNDYLLALTEDGSLAVMNVDDAVKDDVFRIKNQLITLDSGKIVNVMNGIKVQDNKEDETMIIVAEDGKKYDLENFVEEK